MGSTREAFVSETGVGAQGWGPQFDECGDFLDSHRVGTGRTDPGGCHHEDGFSCNEYRDEFAMRKLPLRVSSGVALIVVLWAVSLISAAMLGLAAILQGQLGQEIVSLQSARAGLVAESGIQMALNSQVAPAEIKQATTQLNQRLSDGWKIPVHFEVGDLQGEEGKLNINALLLGDKARAQRVLQNLFASWGVNLSTSTRLIDTLIDWVDSDSLTQPQGAEADDYAKQKRMGPRNGPFESIDELKKVIGWEEMAKEAALGPQGVVNPLKKFTIYGSGKLSLLTADQDVIEIVLDLQPGAATNFMQVRNGADQQAGTPDDLVNTGLLPGVNPAVLAERTTNGGGDLWRVTSTGYVGEAKRTVVALISRNPPQIKARWTEEEDRP